MPRLNTPPSPPLKKDRIRRGAPKSPRIIPVRRISLAVGAILLILIPLFLWQAGYVSRAIDDVIQGFNDVLIEAGLTLNDVAVEGRFLTPPADILDAVGIPKGGFIFSVNVETIQHNLEKLPAIRSAVVERRLPGTVAIRLLERTPIALWQKNGRLQLVDERGDIMGPVTDGMPGNLIIITGDGAPKNAPSLFQVLRDFPHIRAKVTGAIFMGNRRWDLLLNTKIRLKLSETDIRGSLESFRDLEQNHNVTQKDVSAIDVRFKNKVYFYLTPHGAKGRRKPPNKKT